MNILSLFDGISCLQLALKNNNKKVTNYYASEIDKKAIEITQRNFPNTIQLGTVEDIDPDQFKNKIDLMVWGSPCQDLSVLGKREGLAGERSGLFFEALKLRDAIKPRHWLMENVASMSKKNRELISEALGVESVMIDAKRFGCQSRRRLWWASWDIDSRLPSDRPIDMRLMLDPIDTQFDDITDAAKARFQRRMKKGFGHMVSDSDEPVARCFMASDIWGHTIIDRRFDPIRHRWMTQQEQEKIAGFPIGYFDGTAKTRRRHAIGNAFDVRCITAIISTLPA